jgi:uncharacterized protein (TIGR02145 family)
MGQYGNQPDFGTRALAITPKGFAGGSYTNVLYQDSENETQIVYLTNSNLNVSTLNDGNPILKAVDQATWDDYTNSQGVSCWAYYNFDDANAVYGKAYNKIAAANASLYPAGYTLLDSGIASQMTTANGYNQTLGQELKSIPTGFDGEDITGTTLWEYSISAQPGTNAFGFTALPGGFYDGDSWNRINSQALFWDDTTDNIYRMLYNNNAVSQNGIESSDSGYYVRLQVDPTNIEYVEPQPLNSAALYVGTGGDLVVTIVGSKTPVMFKNVPDASFLPIIVSHVWERGDDGLTTASDIIAIY